MCFPGGRGESPSYGFMRCVIGWEPGPVGQMLRKGWRVEGGGLGFRGTERELVSDRCGSLTDKWRDFRLPPAATSFTLRYGSWHHNYIIIARLHLFIQLRATKWTERRVWTRHLVGLRWLIGLLIRRVTTYSKLDIGRRDGCDAVCLMTVFNWSISMGSH